MLVFSERGTSLVGICDTTSDLPAIAADLATRGRCMASKMFLVFANSGLGLLCFPTKYQFGLGNALDSFECSLIESLLAPPFKLQLTDY